MIASLVFYGGSILVLFGAFCVVWPLRRFGVATRRRGFAIGGVGVAIATLALLTPAPEMRVREPITRLDEIVPTWQFHEMHESRINAPPDAVFRAIRNVSADEILLFRTLTTIRGGRRAPTGILNAPERKPLIDVAIEGGFVSLADEPPRELVIGTVLVAPPSVRASGLPLTPAFFGEPLPPGFVIAVMNFVVRPDGAGRSFVTTETRVFASSDRARRGFAVYWRVIYPGSALIRRMWLRAIRIRAEREPSPSTPPL